MIVMDLLKIDLLVDKKVIQETTNRIGIANKKKKILYPSCYVYEMEGDTYLVHFKQLFTLTRENGYDNVSEEDIKRRNSVAFCLKNWQLIDIDDELIEPHDTYLYVLPYKEKSDWNIVHKINIQMLS